MNWSFTFVLLFCLSAHSTTSLRGVYGSDHRQDLHEVKDEKIRAMSHSIVAMMDIHDLEKQGRVYKAAPSSLGEYNNLCPEERFFHQPVTAFCSAALVAPNVILTAGHCIEDKSCADARFVFDYHYDLRDRDLSIIDENKVYSCKKLLHRKENGRLDFAFVELDRPVTDRMPLKLASRNVRLGDDIFMLGYPSGLPLKFSGLGTVQEIMPDFFTAYIDSFMGNSGSAVFSYKTREIVGVLARGNKDFYRDKKRKCYKVVDCKAHECEGEEITHIEPIVEVLGH